MTTNLRRGWEAYFVFTVMLATGRAYSFFTPESSEHLYFQVITAFDPKFPAVYILALLQVGVVIFHLVPLALYAFERTLGPRWFWRVMLVLRAILDLTGNAYTKNVLISLYRNDPWLCAVTFLYLTLPYLPWYWACFRYAFKPLFPTVSIFRKIPRSSP